MNKKALVVDDGNCVGCLACEIACKQEHNTPVGTKLIRVLRDGPRDIDGRPSMRYSVVHCVHCVQPACRDACPAGAISKRNDGIVLIEAALCTGCRNCVAACPFGVMDFESSAGLAEKCDLCFERMDRGFQPACVAACPSRCIAFLDVSESTQSALERKALAWLNLTAR